VRIVSLLSSATEILFGIGAGDDVVAVSHECDYPAAATRLPRATRSRIDSSRPSDEIDRQVKRMLESGEALYEIDRDLIQGMKPDLIVTQAQCDVCAVRYQDVIDFVAAEDGLAHTKVVALNPHRFGDVLDDICRVGEAAHRLPQAVTFRDALQRRHDIVREAVDTARARYAPPGVAILEWIEPLMGAGNWTPELIESAGGRPLLGEAGQHSTYVEWPAVQASRPDVLIIAPCGFDLARSEIESRHQLELPSLKDLPAVANRRANILDGNANLNRSGPRLIDTLEILAHLIQPQCIAAPTGELDEGRAWSRLPAESLAGS
jgi:iron complex transport system substrate-binding protein